MAKVKVSIALSAELERTLRRRSKQEGVSFSSLVDDLLATALRNESDRAATDLLGPRLQTTIKKEVRGMADRLAHLLARAALESSAAKQLIFQVLVREVGADTAFSFRDQARKVSVEDLRKPLEGLAEILEGEEASGNGGEA